MAGVQIVSIGFMLPTAILLLDTVVIPAAAALGLARTGASAPHAQQEAGRLRTPPGIDTTDEAAGTRLRGAAAATLPRGG